MTQDPSNTDGVHDHLPDDGNAAPGSAITAHPTAAAAGAPRDVVSIIAFVLALVGAVLMAVPLGIVGMLRTRAGVRSGRGFALAAFGVSTLWVLATVAVVTSGLLGSGDPLTATDLTQPLATPLATSPTPSPTPSLTISPSSPGPKTAEKPLAKPIRLYWGSLEPGMCVNDLGGSSPKVRVVDCRAPHKVEVTARTKLSGPKRWPGDDKIDALMEGKCRSAFEHYVGIAYDQSELDLNFWTAEKQGWSQGNRTVVCLVYDPEHETTTEALAGTAR